MAASERFEILEPRREIDAAGAIAVLRVTREAKPLDGVAAGLGLRRRGEASSERCGGYQLRKKTEGVLQCHTRDASSHHGDR